MKKLGIFIYLIFYVVIVNGQWTQQNSNITQPLVCVDFSDVNNGWAGGLNLVKTNDGGINWIPANFGSLTFYMNATTVKDIKTFNGSKMIGVGYNNFSTTELIFSTNDGGVSWDTLTGIGGGGLNAIDFINSNNGFSVGYAGNMYKTVNGGVTWSFIISGTTKDLFKIDFFNLDTGIVVGDKVIMRTFNGGVSWVLDTTSISFYDVQCIGNNLCIASGKDGNGSYSLFESTNFGVSWIKKTSIPYNVTNTGRIWAYNQDTIIVPSKNIINSYQNFYWHTYPSSFISGSGKEFEDIHVINGSVAYTVSNDGDIYKTTNLNGYKSVSMFTPNTSASCVNDSVYFLNNSEPLLSYEWYLNGLLYSNSYNSSIVFTSSGLKTILLVVDNGAYRDSSSLNFNINSLPIVNTFNLIVSSDSVCKRKSVALSVVNSQVGVSYQLYQDSVPKNSPIIGNGNNINFITVVDSTSKFMIIGSKSSVCGTLIAFKDTIINVYPSMDPQTQYTVNDSTLCLRDSLIVTFNNTNPNFKYQVFFNGSPSAWYTGNGSTLNINKINVNTTTFVEVRGWYFQPNCNADTLNKTVLAFMDSAIADMTITPNMFSGDTITITNNSVANSYQWSFASNVTPLLSSLHTPYPIADSAMANIEVRFIADGQYGCADTINTHINIFDSINPSPGSYCYVDTLPFHYRIPEKNTYYNYDRIVIDQHTDNKGNSYVCGYFTDIIKKAGQWIPNYFITKIDPNGQIVWDKFQTRQMYSNLPGLHESNYYNSIATCITTDFNGNVYVGGQSKCSGLILPDTTFNFGLMYSTVSHLNLSFLLKFDSLGNTQWGRFETGPNLSSAIPMGVSDILYVDDSHIYYYEFSGNSKGLIQINSAGQYINSGGVKDYHQQGGYSQNMFNVDFPSTGGYVITAPNLYKLCNNDILLSENCPGVTLNFGTSATPISLPSLNTIYNYNHYVGVIDKNTLVFKNGFITHGKTSVNGNILTKRAKVDIDENDNVYVAINYKKQPDEDLVESPNNIITLAGGVNLSNYHFNTAFIAKYDLLGNLIWYNNLSSSELSDIEVADSNVFLIGNFNEIIGSSSQNGKSQGIKSTGKEIFISSYNLFGDLQWLNILENSKHSFAHAMDVSPCGDIFFSGKAEGNIYFDGDSIVSDSNLFIGRYSLSNSCFNNSCSYFNMGSCSSIGNNTYCIGDTVQIHWYSYGNNGTLDITYSMDSGVTNNIIIQNYSSLNSYYNWHPTSSLFNNQWCLLVVKNPNDSTVIDSIWIYFNQSPTVLLNSFPNDTVCINNGIIPLPNGTPSGGVYSGNGISGNNFNPVLSGLGTYQIYYNYTDPNFCEGSDSTQITVVSCVGIDELGTGVEIIISPNPFTNFTTIEFKEDLKGEYDMYVYDIVGKEIHSELKLTGNKFVLQQSVLGKGIYLINLVNNKTGRKFTRKVIAQ